MSEFKVIPIKKDEEDEFDEFEDIILRLIALRDQCKINMVSIVCDFVDEENDNSVLTYYGRGDDA